MLSVRSADTQEQVLRTFLLYGPPRTGKTAFFDSMPGPRLVAEFDPNGALSLHEKDTYVLQVSPDKTGYATLEEVARSLPKLKVSINGEEKEIEVQSFAIDSFTTFAMAFMDSILARSGRMKPEIQDYGLFNDGAKRLIVSIMARVPHFLLTLHDKPIEEDVTLLKYIGPAATGQLSSQIPALFDAFFYTTVRDDGTFTMITRPSKLLRAGTRLFHMAVKEISPNTFDAVQTAVKTAGSLTPAAQPVVVVPAAPKK